VALTGSYPCAIAVTAAIYVIGLPFVALAPETANRPLAGLTNMPTGPSKGWMAPLRIFDNGRILSLLCKFFREVRKPV
jgi:hypothetical protein